MEKYLAGDNSDLHLRLLLSFSCSNRMILFLIIILIPFGPSLVSVVWDYAQRWPRSIVHLLFALLNSNWNFSWCWFVRLLWPYRHQIGGKEICFKWVTTIWFFRNYEIICIDLLLYTKSKSKQARNWLRIDNSNGKRSNYLIFEWKQNLSKKKTIASSMAIVNPFNNPISPFHMQRTCSSCSLK